MRRELVPLWMGLLLRLIADRWGQPVANHPVSAYLWHICASRLWSAISLLKYGWLSRKDYVLQPRACKLAHIHDAFTALHISCMTFHLLVMPISQCNAQVFDCSRCLGGLAGWTNGTWRQNSWDSKHLKFTAIVLHGNVAQIIEIQLSIRWGQPVFTE